MSGKLSASCNHDTSFDETLNGEIWARHRVNRTRPLHRRHRAQWLSHGQETTLPNTVRIEVAYSVFFCATERWEVCVGATVRPVPKDNLSSA